MKIRSGHTRTNAAAPGLRLLFSMAFLLLLLCPGPARAEDAEPVRPEPEEESADIYYTAMLRSIELDRSRWKSFSRSMEGGPWFYDTGSIKRAGNIVTVNVTVYPHPNRTGMYRSVYAEDPKIRKIDFVTEFDCRGAGYRQPLIRVYGYYRELLAEHTPEGTGKRYTPVKPGTTTDTLRQLVCTGYRSRKR